MGGVVLVFSDDSLGSASIMCFSNEIDSQVPKAKVSFILGQRKLLRAAFSLSPGHLAQANAQSLIPLPPRTPRSKEGVHILGA